MKGDLILQTKLIPPQIKGKILRRERLLNRLKDNLEKKLVLICADAGYGKTTLLTDLVQCVKKPYIWYALDSDDRFFVLFIKHLITGIKKYLPEFGESLIARLSKPMHSASQHEVLITFTNELQTVPHVDFWLILDDYHTISDSKEINECVNFLLSHSPPNLHLIVSTRAKPSLLVQRLKSKGKCYELSAKDLEFTHDETVMLFQNIWGLNYDKEEITRLWSRTTGWVTGLYLYMIFLKDKKDIDLTTIPSEVRKDLYEYLAEEVLLNQPKAIQHFLLKTSVLNVLQAKVCNELLEIKNSQRLLRQLEKSGFFTCCIDSKQGLYQYHPLFREFLMSSLERTLSSGKLSKLYGKAGRILENLEDRFGALECFIKIKKWQEATNILYKIMKDEKQRSKIQQIEDYLNKFPRNYAEKDSRLLLVKSLITYYRERFQDAFLLLKQLRKKLKARNKRKELLRVLTTEANAYVRLGNCKEALALSEEALRLQPKGKEKADVLCFAKGVSLLHLGRIEEAEVSLSTAYEIYTKIGNLTHKSEAMVHLALLNYQIGNLITAKQYLEPVQITFEELKDNLSLGLVLVNLAAVYNLLREDQRASEVIERAIDIGTKFDIKEVLGNALWSLANLRCNKGDEQGYKFFEQAIQIFAEIGNNYDVVKARLSYANARRLNGYALEAMKLVNKAKEEIKTFNFDMLIPRYKTIRGIIECELGYYSKAKDDLNEALARFKNIGNKYYIFLNNFYLARLYYLLKDKNLLLEILKECIASARDNHYEMIFITEQSISAPLLTFYFSHNPDDEYVISILEKLGRGTTEYLLLLINEENISLSKSVIELLSRIGDPKALNVLRECLNREGLKESANFALKCILQKKPPILKIHFLGKMEVYKNGVLIKEWNPRSAKFLFQFLLLNKGKGTHREKIMEKLWPNSPPDKVSEKFYKALSCLRKILEPERTRYSKSSSIRSEREYCWFEMKEGDWYDVEKFLEYYRIGKIKEKGEPEACLDAYKKAGDIYRGDLLSEELYVDWIEQERRRLKEIYIEILFRSASLFIRKDEYSQAIEFHRQILTLDPCNESSHRELILCYLKENNRRAAIEQYNACEEVLKQKLGLHPSEETKKLFEAILT